ncbi:hypothetical protein P7H20_12290 [Paenibacillus larvae]|nr:hypothetical protein [Paenibacillus larvae]MDT2275469.1 hypothetical protein [Paenibacillus larvae]
MIGMNLEIFLIISDLNLDFSELNVFEELAEWSASMDGYWEDFNASIQHKELFCGEILSNIHIGTSKNRRSWCDKD